MFNRFHTAQVTNADLRARSDDGTAHGYPACALYPNSGHYRHLRWLVPVRVASSPGYVVEVDHADFEAIRASTDFAAIRGSTAKIVAPCWQGSVLKNIGL